MCAVLLIMAVFSPCADTLLLMDGLLTEQEFSAGTQSVSPSFPNLLSQQRFSQVKADSQYSPIVKDSISL